MHILWPHLYSCGHQGLKWNKPHWSWRDIQTFWPRNEMAGWTIKVQRELAISRGHPSHRRFQAFLDQRPKRHHSEHTRIEHADRMILFTFAVYFRQRARRKWSYFVYFELELAQTRLPSPSSPSHMRTLQNA